MKLLQIKGAGDTILMQDLQKSQLSSTGTAAHAEPGVNIYRALCGWAGNSITRCARHNIRGPQLMNDSISSILPDALPAMNARSVVGTTLGRSKEKTFHPLVKSFCARPAAALIWGVSICLANF
jgi:hypothetical protein